MGLQVTPTARLFIQLVACVIIVFGCAYAMIARDPVRYRPYILLGMVLKLAVVAFVYGYWVAGVIGYPLPALAAVDAVYAALFLRFHRRSRNTFQLTESTNGFKRSLESE
jgi:hypothetical protein